MERIGVRVEKNDPRIPRLLDEVKEREAAFRAYDDALVAGHGAALLEQERPNVFTANVGNLLPGEETTTEVEIDLPRREVLPFGPWWLRTWEFVFFTTLVAASLAIKLLFRLV